jgi:hypothetical protein
MDTPFVRIHRFRVFPQQFLEVMGFMITGLTDRKPADKPLPQAGRQVHFVSIQRHPMRNDLVSFLVELLFHRKSPPGGIRISTASGFAFRFGMRFHERGVYGQGLLDLKPSALQLPAQLFVQPRPDRLDPVTEYHKGGVIRYFLIQGKTGELAEINPKLQRLTQPVVA